METVFETQRTCARSIAIEIEEKLIMKVVFNGGCTGNTAGLSALLKGMPVDEVITKLKGIICRNGTSCPDQLAQALESLLIKKAS